jgi:UDP-N-acetylmuramyl pentapeptide phosphotransferase/UDP-N-acetylglucosamine-1-phosphate transferase
MFHLSRLIPDPPGDAMSDTASLGHVLLRLGSALVFAALVSTLLIVALRPLLKSYALARPNSRSSHREPTPQGGGIAVVAAMLASAWGAIAMSPMLLQDGAGQFLTLIAAVVLLAIVGAIDDIRSLPELPRLALQCVAVGAVVAALPAQQQIAPLVPWWVERAGLVVGLVWLVNLVNFMDGIDWMTVAEVVPVSTAIVVLGLLDAVAPLPTLVAAALLGAVVGFAPFNKPVARLFLGDVGSLPIGLLIGWLLLQLAARGHPVAALLLPLYYVADTTITLVRRLVAGEPFWQAHRTHFYQRATDGGFTVTEIVARVFAVNLCLAALALATVLKPGTATGIAALVLGIAIVAWLLVTFARGKR